MKTDYSVIVVLTISLMFSILLNLQAFNGLSDQHDREIYLQEQLNKCTDIEW